MKLDSRQIHVKAVERFMTRWPRGEVEKGWLRHANEDAKKGEKEKVHRVRGAGRAAELIPLSMKAEKNWPIV